MNTSIFGRGQNGIDGRGAAATGFKRETQPSASVAERPPATAAHSRYIVADHPPRVLEILAEIHRD
ncbi:MAG: hypothetical protein ACREQF_03890, partial [Candidatus Binataceae bacterium]